VGRVRKKLGWGPDERGHDHPVWMVGIHRGKDGGKDDLRWTNVCRGSLSSKGSKKDVVPA